MYTPIRALKSALDTLQELDSLMVDIAKVTNLSAEAMENLKTNSFAASSAYGRTAKDYLASVAEFSRAGYDDQASNLSKLSLLAQNVGELTADQANQFLLATDAAYKYAGSQEKLSQVLDGVNQIDNKYATSIAKISEGVTVAGSISSQAKVDISELSSAIGVMTTVSQRSGNEAGRAFRSILMNLRQIKGETEDGEIIDDASLSKSAEVLDGIGIKVHEMKNGIEELRDPMKILKELADKFNSGELSSMQTAPILEALGGKYRANQLSALLSNWDMYEQMLTEYATASGSAMSENEKRMDSWQAKSNQLSNVLGSLANNIIDTNLVKNIIDLGNGIVGFFNVLAQNPVSSFIVQIGLLTTGFILLNSVLKTAGATTLITNLITGFTTFGATISSMVVQTNALIGAQLTLRTTLLGLTGIWVSSTAAIIGTAAIFIGIAYAIDYASSANKRYIESQNKIITKSQENIKGYQSEIDKLNQLQTALQGSVTDKSKLWAIQKDLNDAIGKTPNLLTGESSAIDVANLKIRDRIKQLKLLREEDEKKSITANKNIFDNKDFYGSGVLGTNFLAGSMDKSEALKIFRGEEKSIFQVDDKTKEKIKTYVNDLVKQAQEIYKDSIDNSDFTEPTKKLANDIIESFTIKGMNLDQIGTEIKKLFPTFKNITDLTNEFYQAQAKGDKIGSDKYFKQMNQAVNDLSKTYGVSEEAIKSFLSTIGVMQSESSSSTSKVQGMTTTVEKLDKSVDDTQSAFSDLNDVLNDMNDGNTLNSSQIIDLIQKYPQLATAITKTADGYKINQEALKSLMQQEIDGQISTLNIQLTKTKSAVDGSKDRIAAIRSEVVAMGLLTEAEAASQTDSDITKIYDDKIAQINNVKNALLGLKGDIGKDTGKGGSTENKPLTALLAEISHLKEIDQLTTQQELNRIKNNKKLFQSDAEKLDYQERIYTLQKKINDDAKEAADSAFQHQVALGNKTTQDQIDYYTNELNNTSITADRYKLEEQIQTLKKQQADDAKQLADANFAHYIAMNEQSAALTQQQIDYYTNELANMQILSTNLAERQSLEEKIYNLKKQQTDEIESQLEKTRSLTQLGLDLAGVQANKDTMRLGVNGWELVADETKIKSITDQMVSFMQQNPTFNVNNLPDFSSPSILTSTAVTNNQGQTLGINTLNLTMNGVNDINALITQLQQLVKSNVGTPSYSY